MADTAPVTTEASAPPPETAAPETPVEVSAKVKALQELGFENVTSDDEAFERLTQAYKQTKEQFSTELKSALDELRAQVPAQPTSPKVQEAQDGHWWNPPKVDESLAAKYRTADGWKPETPTEIRQQAEAAQAYYDRWANDLVKRPHEVLPKLIREEALRIVREELGQTAQQQKEAQLQQKVFADNPWLFEKNPVSGAPTEQLSTEGQLLNQYFIEAQSDGASFERAWKYAHAMYQAGKVAAQSKLTTSSQSATQVNDEKKREFLNRAGGGVNRTGSLPAPSENRVTQRNKNLTFGQRAAQVASRNGVAVQ
jgi:hypothetical protein